ncbi:MAG: GGDEF domain-containing protein [Rubrobacter sp.]|nr:GGDEF domain-containing protein [Rubrobacter sp.]
MRSESGDVEGMIGVATDVSERHKLQKEFEYRAFHDPLTGLPNRDLFMDRLEHALVKAERRGESVAVIYMDLGNLKAVNDSMGHEAGDDLLVSVAERLKECLRRGDSCARLGGGEFAVLIEEAGAEKAAEVSRRISAAFRKPLSGRSTTVIAPSIGTALSPKDGENPKELIKAADRAMYAAKARSEAENPEA